MGKRITVETHGAKVKKICDVMRQGNSARQACELLKIPHSSFFDWINAKQEFADQYAHAREAYIDKIAADILIISDEDAGVDDRGRVDHGMVQKQRLRVDTRKWLLSKLAPKKYGDKLQLSGDDERPLKIEKIERVVLNVNITNKNA